MKDVDFVFCLGLVDEEVDGDERSRPSDASAVQIMQRLYKP
jgi:hypothetical protein